MADEKRAGHPKVNYERTDVRFRGVAIVLAVALGLAAALFFSVSMFFRQQERRLEAAKESSYPLVPPPTPQLPPAPRLEQLDRSIGNETPNVYRRELRSEEVLSNYGSTEEKGYVRVPIGRAMDQILGELPIRKGPAPSPSNDNGLINDGDSNSGRLFQKGAQP